MWMCESSVNGKVNFQGMLHIFIISPLPDDLKILYN